MAKRPPAARPHQPTDVFELITRASPRNTSRPAPLAAPLLQRAAHRRPLQAIPPPPATAEATTTTPLPSPSVDLFAHDALDRAQSTSSATTASLDPGGHLRRATDPISPPDPTLERETVGHRVREMVGDLVGRERVQSGNVPSRWRDVERHLVQTFHPPLAVVKQESVLKALGHQVLRSWLDGPPHVGPVPRGVDASVQTLLGTPEGLNVRSLPQDQALAVQARWGDPAVWLIVEVEVVIDDAGQVISARVVRPSGRRLFDRTALAAVEDAVRAGGVAGEHRAIRSRWIVEASVAVAPPTAIGFRFDETGHLDPSATGIRRYVGGTYPLQQSVRTHVSLSSIEQQP
jgi:TonB-like protein